jgi:hypothetical protein
VFILNGSSGSTTEDVESEGAEKLLVLGAEMEREESASDADATSGSVEIEEGS